MIIYVVIALFLLIGGASKQKKHAYRIGFIILFFLTAFRSPFLSGNDYYAYSNYFSEVKSLIHWGEMGDTYYEVGYQFLNSFTKLFTDNYVGFQIVYSIIVFFMMYLVLRELEFDYSQKCLFLFSFFCYHFIWDTWIILRQNISDWLFWLLIILAYKCKNDEKVKKLFLILLSISLPILFHSAAALNVILVPIMLLLGKISSKNRLIIVPAVSIGILLVGKFAYGFIVSSILPLVRSDMSNYGLDESSIINYFIKLLLFIIFARGYEFEQNPQKKLMFDTLTMMILIGSLNVVAATRLCEFYAIGLYSSMALLMNRFKYNCRKAVYFAYGFVMICILLHFIMTFDGGQVFTHYSLVV